MRSSALTSQLQLSPSGQVQLTVKVNLTLSNYIWQSTILAGGSTLRDVAAFWSAAAKTVPADHGWATMGLTSQSALLRFVELKANEKISENLGMRSQDMESPGWLTVPVATRTVLLMVACVLQTRFMLQSGLNRDACTQTAVQELVHKLDQIRQTTSIAPPDSLSSSGQCKALRSLLLLAKPACLLTFIGMHPTSLPLWTAAQLESINLTRLGTSNRQTDADVQESQKLGKLLVQLLVPALKVLVKAKSSPAASAMSHCCFILRLLLESKQPGLHITTATELVSSGRAHQICVHTALHSLMICNWSTGKVHQYLLQNAVLDGSKTCVFSANSFVKTCLHFLATS